MKKHALWLLLPALLMIGCTPTHAQDGEDLIVFAAASLANVFEEIALEFEAAHPGVDVIFNFGGSSDLAAQLEEGAPADIFASANDRQMQVAVDAERVSGEPRTFAKNRLVLIVPADNPANIASLDDLAARSVALVIAAPAVPVRDYTDTMLEQLAADPAYSEDYVAAFMANVVSEEENARQVAAKVALGEADAGIVYFSDVTPDIADQVIAITIPDTINTVASYPIAVTDDPANPAIAQAFVDFVISDAGQDVLVKWNFIPADAAAQPCDIEVSGANPVY